MVVSTLRIVHPLGLLGMSRMLFIILMRGMRLYPQETHDGFMTDGEMRDARANRLPWYLIDIMLRDDFKDQQALLAEYSDAQLHCKTAKERVEFIKDKFGLVGTSVSNDEIIKFNTPHEHGLSLEMAKTDNWGRNFTCVYDYIQKYMSNYVMHTLVDQEEYVDVLLHYIKYIPTAITKNETRLIFYDYPHGNSRVTDLIVNTVKDNFITDGVVESDLYGSPNLKGIVFRREV
jgi:hypothetical protein